MNMRIAQKFLLLEKIFLPPSELHKKQDSEFEDPLSKLHRKDGHPLEQLSTASQSCNLKKGIQHPRDEEGNPLIHIPEIS